MDANPILFEYYANDFTFVFLSNSFGNDKYDITRYAQNFEMVNGGAYHYPLVPQKSALNFPGPGYVTIFIEYDHLLGTDINSVLESTPWENTWVLKRDAWSLVTDTDESVVTNYYNRLMPFVSDRSFRTTPTGGWYTSKSENYMVNKPSVTFFHFHDTYNMGRNKIILICEVVSNTNYYLRYEGGLNPSFSASPGEDSFIVYWPLDLYYQFTAERPDKEFSGHQ